ncbi:hypothetical protein BJX96DRAFT_167871 [Aspergillus floccosus]
MVSMLTQSTSLSVRLWTSLGGFAIDGMRVTTLTGLELSRAVLEGIMVRAGRDVVLRSSGEHGKAEAESILERSLATIHTVITSTSLFAAASFHFYSTTINSAGHMSQEVLSTLDAILGSTESSRAIAAIITLIRREFRGPRVEAGTDQIGVGDLLIGTVGFAMLQRWGRRATERHLRADGGDEVVWDVVILDSGVRADVVGTHQISPASPDGISDDTKRSSFISPGNDDDTFDAVQRPKSSDGVVGQASLSLSPSNQNQMSDEDIRLYILSQIPKGCRASIKTDIVTTRTITVDIYDDDTAEIAAPPGTMMIEERFHNDPYNDSNAPEPSQQLPKHTVVFRTALNRSQSADIRSPQRTDRTGVHEIEPEQDGSSTTRLPPHGVVFPDSPPDVPPKNNDTGNTMPDEQVQRENKNLKTADEHIGPREKRTGEPNAPKPHRASASQLSLTEPESTPKNSFGKASFTRFAQRVKPAGNEKNEHGKRPSLKSAFERPSASSTDTSQRSKVSRTLVPERKPPYRSYTPESNRKNTTASKAGTSSVANSGLPRSPMQNSRLGSSSPTARRANPRDIRSGRTSRPDYYSVQEKTQESFVSQTDAYSLRSVDNRPGSSAGMRAHVRSSSSMSLTRSEQDMTVSVGEGRPSSSTLHHRRSKSYTPSVYSLATADSETSLILAHRARKSAYDDMSTMQSLNRDGLIPGMFPQKHFVHNIRRFCRFSSASYGSNALKVMGVPQSAKALPQQESDSQEHSFFSDHTGLPASTILLSSFVDPAGGSNAAGETGTGFPLVHYLFLDHDSKAVVLTLRGTWGFEDVLTDMTCDYDDLEWQGKNWKVHKGMHASAKRLLMGGGGRVMITLKAALEEFPDYGVILCGHSLGGGVAAILATMLSEPSSDGPGMPFITSSHHSTARRMILSGHSSDEAQPNNMHFLPPGRPIHVYAYGPPAAMSPFLRRATRGLVTTVVNGQDAVPSLSLGILHDMHTVSLAFKSDISRAQTNVRRRVWESLRQSILHKFYVNEPPILLHAGNGIGEDAWAWETLKMLREEMLAPKLMPPGEVFVVETMRVLQRNAFTSDSGDDGYPRLGRPATRVQLKFIRDVESVFGELRFGSGMFSDHNPASYEASISALARGILDD